MVTDAADTRDADAACWLFIAKHTAVVRTPPTRDRIEFGGFDRLGIVSPDSHPQDKPNHTGGLTVYHRGHVLTQG